MKFIKRTTPTDFVANQTVTIGAGGGTDTVENIPNLPDTAIEVELEDGNVVVLLGYLRK